MSGKYQSVDSLRDENYNLKTLISDERKALQVLKNDVNLIVDERNLIEEKLSDSASEIASLKDKCELQCDYCGQNVENLIILQDHKQNHHIKAIKTKAQWKCKKNHVFSSYSITDVSIKFIFKAK